MAAWINGSSEHIAHMKQFMAEQGFAAEKRPDWARKIGSVAYDSILNAKLQLAN